MTYFVLFILNSTAVFHIIFPFTFIFKCPI
jgi:hypothetical protein